MRADNFTRLLIRLRIAKTAILRACFTSRVRMRCLVWGIELGRGVVVEGMPILYRSPESVFVIGSESMLLSIPRANFAGINRPCSLSTLLPGATLTLGKRCGLSGAVISAALSVTLGDDVLCGANTTIVDNDFHHVDPARRSDFMGIPAAAVWIEDNVWLGMGSTVLKGVRIGRNSVIAAGSIVSRDIPSDVVAGGVPAKVLRSLKVPLSTESGEPDPLASSANQAISSGFV